MSESIIVNDKEVIGSVEISADEIMIETGEKNMVAELLDTTENKQSILLNSKIENIYTVKNKDGIYIWHDGKAVLVKKQSSKRGRVGTSSVQTDITPKTPGTVIRILVEEGDRVEKGQELIVISAMKMETPLYAGFDAVVKAVNTSEGANVMPGEILIDLKSVEGEKNE